MSSQRAFEAEVLHVFHDYWRTYAQRGDDAFTRTLASCAPEVTGFGTGRDEVVSDRAGLARFIQREHQEVSAP